MDIVSILAIGTIGLGFLLAVLAYRLLSAGPSDPRPIYIYMFFCFTLVVVGGLLQYYDNGNRYSLKVLDRDYQLVTSQRDDLQNKLIESQSLVTETQNRLTESIASFAKLQSEANRLQLVKERQNNVLNDLVASSLDTIKELQSIPSVIALNCGGGGPNGQPAANNPIVVDITGRAASTLAGYRAASISAIDSP